MIVLGLILIGFAIAWYCSLRVTFGVGAVILCAVIVFFIVLAKNEVPAFDVITPSMLEFYMSAAMTGMSALFVFGFALMGIAYTVGVYSVGAIAGRVALRVKERNNETAD